MKTFRVSFLAGLVLLLLISVPAQAALQVDYRLDGGSLTPIALTPAFILPGSTAAGTYGLVLGGVLAIEGRASSNPPGGSIAKVLASTNDILNLTGTGHRLELFIGDTDYTAPAAPPFPGITINSHIGGSVSVASAANTMAFSSCADTLNGQNTCGPIVPATITTAGPGSPVITSGSFNDDQVTKMSVLGTPYSISQYVDLYLGSHAEINFSNNTTLTPIPEPISIALLGGVLVFTSGLIRRRAKGGPAA